MEYLKIITNILEDELGIERNIIEKAVKKSDVVKNGDYNILCYLLIDVFQENPVSIAEKIKRIMKKYSFYKLETSGAYVNIFIKKEDKYKEEILIAYCIEKEDVLSLQDIYNLITSEFISRIYLENGYLTEKYSYNKKKENINDKKYFIEKIKENNLVEDYFGEKIVSLKKYNLPPLLIEEDCYDKYQITLGGIAEILNRQKEVSQSVIIINKYEKIRYKQVMSLVDSVNINKKMRFSHIELGNVKVNETIKRYIDFSRQSVDVFLKKAEKSVKDVMEYNQLVLEEVEVSKIVFEIIIFNFLKSNFGYDVILDYNNMFAYNKKSYLYIKVMHKNIYNEIKKNENKIDATLHRDSDLNNGKELINIIEEYDAVIRDVLQKTEASIIVEYLNRIMQIMSEFYTDDGKLSFGSSIDEYSKLTILKRVYEIIEKLLDILCVNNNMLIRIIEKLTVY